jgi:hypothetical protein
MRHSQKAPDDHSAVHVCPSKEARITSHESQITILQPRIANIESLLANHHSLITHFLIGFSPIRNPRNQMKTNGRLPF